MISWSKTLRLLAHLAGLALCSNPAHATDRTVVVLQGVTGAAAFIGAPAAEGMKFAAEQLNAKAFLGADKLNVIVVDSASDRGQAMAAVSRHALDPNVLAIMGPTTSVAGIPAAAIANEQKIPIMEMTLAQAVLRAGPWSFIGAQIPETTMPMLGDYALNTLKVKRCAMIHFADNEAYIDLARAFRTHTEPRGIKFVEFTGIKSTDVDFSAIVTRIVAAKPDCVLLFTVGPVAANLVIQLKQAGLDPNTKLIGQSGVASPQLVKIGGAAVEGLVFNSDWTPGGSTPMSKAFAEGYKKAKGIDADNWVALGYSYMTVMATAIKNAGPNPTREKVRDALTKTKDVPIVAGTGSFSYDERRIPHYGVNFLTVKNGQFVGVQ